MKEKRDIKAAGNIKRGTRRQSSSREYKEEEKKDRAAAGNIKRGTRRQSSSSRNIKKRERKTE